MADVNTSSYPTIQPYKPPDGMNALGTYGQVTDIGNKLLQQQQQRLGIQQQQLELANKHAATIQDNLSSLISNPNLSTKDIISTLGGLIANGRITPQEAANELGTIPSGPDGSDATSAQLQQHLVPYLLKSMDSQQRMNAMYGSPTAINTGGATQVNAISPISGVRPMANIANTLPPTATTMRGNQPTYVGGVEGASPVDLNSASPTGAIPNPPSGAPGTIPSGPPLGAEAAANAAASKSGGAFADTLQASQGYNTRMFQLTNALENVQKLGSTGPGTETRNYMASFLQNADPGVLKAIGIVDPTKISNFNEAKKYMTQFAQNRAQQFGGGTDAELATSLASNPNIDTLDKLSNTQLIKANIALENMHQAATLEAIKNNVPPQDFQKFAAQWGNSVDPRAFSIDLLPKNKQAALVNGLSTEERPKFAAGLRAMKQNNITIPNVQNLTGE